MIRRILAAVFSLALAVLVLPRGARADARLDFQVVPPNPQAGQVFQLFYRLTLENESDPQVLPFDFGGLRVMGDRSPPSVQGGFVGGFSFRSSMGATVRMSMQTQGQYLLVAPAPGRYRISNIRIVNASTQRQIFQHPPLVIDVGGTAPVDAGISTGDTDVDAGDAVRSEPPLESPDAPPRGDITGAVYDPRGFVRVLLDPPEPYLGQQVTLRAWLYVPTSETRCEISHTPSLEGFWSQPVDDGGRACASQWFTREVAGRYWAAGMIYKIALFPSQTGTLTVGNFDVVAEVMTSNFFNPMVQLRTSSQPLQVQVRDAPEAGRPAGFVPGTVGPVTMSADVDRAEVPVGETVTLTVRAQSEGSLASAVVNVPEHVDGVRVRQGGVRTFHKVEGGRVINSLSAEVLLVPERPGTFDIGAVELPYWDPASGQYGRAVAVVPPLRATGAALPREQGPSDHPDPAMELRPLVDAPALRPHAVMFRSPGAALAAVLFPPVALALGAGGTLLARTLSRRRKEREGALRADPHHALDEARALLASDPAQAVSRAARALDLAVARERDERDGGLDALTEATRAAIDDARRACNTARFAGENAGGNAGEVVDLVARAMTAMESEA